jgi:hypothetical protein
VWYYNSEREPQPKLARLGIEAVPVENLHCSIYLSERTAVATSLSLQQRAAAHLIDVGYRTDTAQEYQAALAFLRNHVLPAAVPEVCSMPPLMVVSTTELPEDGVAAAVNALVHDRIRRRVSTGKLNEEQVHYMLRGVVLEDFVPHIALILDIRQRADRLILQPRGNEQQRTDTYGYLTYYREVLEQTLGGARIEVGQNTKRLICPLPTDHRRLRPDGTLSRAYTAAIAQLLNATFGPMRDGLQSLMAPEYHLVG